MPHQITTFTESQNKKLAADLQLGREIVAQTCSDSRKIDAAALDQAFLAWAKEQKKYTREQVASGLGSLLGELIKIDFAFSWKMVEDELGIEAALIDDASGSIVFPLNSVWKRLDPEIIAEPFFAPMYQAIKLHLEKTKGNA